MVEQTFLNFAPMSSNPTDGGFIIEETVFIMEAFSRPGPGCSV